MSTTIPFDGKSLAAFADRLDRAGPLTFRRSGEFQAPVEQCNEFPSLFRHIGPVRYFVRTPPFQVLHFDTVSQVVAHLRAVAARNMGTGRDDA